MDNHEPYENAVHRLAGYDYEVIPDGQGYIVRHLVDHNDISHMRDLADLVDFAELIEWAAQHRAPGSLDKREQEARSANLPAPQHQ